MTAPDGLTLLLREITRAQCDVVLDYRLGGGWMATLRLPATRGVESEIVVGRGTTPLKASKDAWSQAHGQVAA